MAEKRGRVIWQEHRRYCSDRADPSEGYYAAVADRDGVVAGTAVDHRAHGVAVAAEHDEVVAGAAVQAVATAATRQGVVAIATDQGVGRRVAAEQQETAIGFGRTVRSEEHTSELQSLMRISYAVFCLKKKNKMIHEITIRHS